MIWPGCRGQAFSRGAHAVASLRRSDWRLASFFAYLVGALFGQLFVYSCILSLVFGKVLLYLFGWKHQFARSRSEGICKAVNSLRFGLLCADFIVEDFAGRHSRPKRQLTQPHVVSLECSGEPRQLEKLRPGQGFWGRSHL